MLSYFYVRRVDVRHIDYLKFQQFIVERKATFLKMKDEFKMYLDEN